MGQEEWICWRSSVVDAILAESADFPHHLANGVRELAKVVYAEGVRAAPPIETLRYKCGERRREYYEHRLVEFKAHTIALGAAFSPAGGTAREDVLLRTLMATNNRGGAVSAAAAENVIVGMIAAGFLEATGTGGMLRVALPSLATYLNEEYRGRPQDHAAVRNLQRA